MVNDLVFVPALVLVCQQHISQYLSQKIKISSKENCQILLLFVISVVESGTWIPLIKLL